MSRDVPNIRLMVRGVYDLQKVRIEQGNRLSANFRAKLGLPVGKKESKKDVPKILKDLRVRYERITDGIAQVTRKRNYDFDGVISDFTELQIVGQFLELDAAEKRQFRQLKSIVEEHPMWDHFFRDVRGCGHAMAAVIISEVDIRKARRISSLWRYAGVDVVTRRYKVGDDGDGPAYVEQFHHDAYSVTVTPGFWNVYDKESGAFWGKYALQMDRLGEGRGRSRRKEHLVDVTYTDKEGNVKTKKSITNNPFLKTKLVQVLAGCFIKSGGTYRDVYDTYKEKITQREEKKPVDEQRTKGHIHRMAKRKMIKAFLADLWVAWRELEGLEVTPTYYEAKMRGKAA